MSRTDVERLRLFCASVDDALNRRAVRQATVSSAFRFQYTPEEGLSLTTDRGDEEDMRSLLLAVRRFFSAGEDVQFTGIANVVERLVQEPELREANRANRRAWNRLRRGGLHFHVDGVNYAPEDGFDILVNGKLFHDDAAKAAVYDRLPSIFQQWLLTEVNRMVIDALQVLHAERELITEAFTRQAILTATSSAQR